jgi:hypothetical protein
MPADRDLTLKVTALAQKVVNVLRSADSSSSADELLRCLDDLADPDASHLDALRKIESMCGPKWLGDDYAAASSCSDWEQLLAQLRQQASEAAASVFRADTK